MTRSLFCVQKLCTGQNVDVIGQDQHCDVKSTVLLLGGGGLPKTDCDFGEVT